MDVILCARFRLLTVVITLFLTNVQCTTKYFPLCPKLANTKASPYKDVGFQLYQACIDRRIKIHILSSNVAEFQGTKRQLRWLQKNYSILMCDFDQDTTTWGADEYTRCISNSAGWIKVVQSKNFNTLMEAGTYYCPNCVPNQMCF